MMISELLRAAFGEIKCEYVKVGCNSQYKKSI